MKNKIIKILSILIILAFIGIIISGMFLKSTLMVVGGVVILFNLAFVVSILIFMRLIKEVKSERKNSNVDKKKSEEQSIEDVNSSYGYNNQIIRGKRMMHAVADNWKISSFGDKIKGFLFLFIFIGCCVMFVVFGSMGKITWALISWGVGAALILGALIIKKILEAVSIKKSKKPKEDYIISSKYSVLDALVEDCVFSSESYVGTGCEIHSTDRIVNTNYKVVLNVNNTKKIAYSKKFYNPGTAVNVLVKGSSKFVSILQETPDDNY